MPTVATSFRADFSPSTAGFGPIPWDNLDVLVLRARNELLAQQRPDGSWGDSQMARRTLLMEWLIAAAFVPGLSPIDVASSIDELLEAREPDGSWGGTDATLTAYLALVLHHVSEDRVRPTRDWLLDRSSLSPSPRTRLLLRGTGQLPHLILDEAGEFDSMDDVYAARVLSVMTVPEAHSRDPVLSHVFRDQNCPDRRWSGVGWPRLKLRRAMKALTEWIDAADRTPRGSILSILALRAGAGVASASRCRQLLDEMNKALRDPEAAIHPAQAPRVVEQTTFAFRALIEAGLPWDHPALVAADDWIWRRLQQSTVQIGCSPQRLAQLLHALSARPSELADDRAWLVEKALNDLLHHLSARGRWPSPELLGIVLECLGRYGVGARQPLIEEMIHHVECSQKAEGDWPSRRPLFATACIVRGMIAVGRSPRSDTIRQACCFLDQQLRQHLQTYAPEEGLTTTVIAAIDALLDADAADGALLGEIAARLNRSQPQTLEARAGRLWLAARLCRRTCPRPWF